MNYETSPAIITEVSEDTSTPIITIKWLTTQDKSVIFKNQIQQVINPNARMRLRGDNVTYRVFPLHDRYHNTQEFQEATRAMTRYHNINNDNNNMDFNNDDIYDDNDNQMIAAKETQLVSNGQKSCPI